jgi:hypothetical protein
MVLQCINGVGSNPVEGRTKYLTALKSNSNTVWFNFQTYIIFSINLVSLVTLRSSGTGILYGCHLLLDVCIIYFISCDYNEFFIILCNMLKIAELDCCQIIILSIYVPSTHAYTHVLRISLDLPYEKR